MLQGILENLGLVDVNIVGYSYVGALSGYLGRNSSVERSFSTGYLKATNGNMVGGLVASMFTGSSVKDSYSISTVIGSDTGSGGLVGYAGDSSILNSYSVNIFPKKVRGGLLGFNQGNVFLRGTNSFWDSEYSKIDFSFAGEAKNTRQMKQISTYNNWDFNSIWNIDSRVNNGYPYLLSFTN